MDKGKYAEMLENKYKRALKLIEEAQMDRQEVEK